jgi:hypothetical protein
MLSVVDRNGSGESTGGVSRPVCSCPGDDLAAPTDDVAVIKDEDGHGTLAAEALDLRAVTRTRGPGPGSYTSTVNPLDLIRVPGVIKCLCSPSARMGKRRWRAAGELLERAGVENHTARAYPAVSRIGKARLQEIQSVGRK